MTKALIDRIKIGCFGLDPIDPLRLLLDEVIEALAQPEHEREAYDKTEINCFVQDLYDKKMQEGKHGHYETMFHVVHQAIKKVPPQRTWVGLTGEEKHEIRYSHMNSAEFIEFIEAKLKEKNNV